MDEEIKTIYNELSESNKDVLNLVAKGMMVAQEAKVENEEKNMEGK